MTIVTQYSWETDTFTDHALTTERQAFRDALHVVAEKATTKLPECNGRVAKAVALVLSGDVTLQADGRALVSSQCDPAKQYRVERGTCTCKDFEHAPHGLCKHRLAVALTRRALALTSHQAEIPMVPAAQEHAPAAADHSALPEAPASANCHVMIAGRQVQITLRDTCEVRLLARLTTLLAQYPVEQSQAVRVATGGTEPGWCALHNVSMRLNTKDGRSWYSHKREDGSWCKGKPQGQGRL